MIVCDRCKSARNVNEYRWTSKRNSTDPVSITHIPIHRKDLCETCAEVVNQAIEAVLHSDQ